MLSGQRVVPFGGGSGIGLATARLAQSYGAEVTIVGRDPAKLQASSTVTAGCGSGTEAAGQRGSLRSGSRGC